MVEVPVKTVAKHGQDSMTDLFNVLQRHASKEFNYGDEDCCQFIRDCVKAYHGKDYGSEFTYSGEDGAQELLDKHGGLTGLLTHILGEPYEGCKTGDVVVCEMYNGKEIAGIIYNDRIVVKTKKSIVDWPIGYAKHIWEIDEHG